MFTEGTFASSAQATRRPVTQFIPSGKEFYMAGKIEEAEFSFSPLVSGCETGGKRLVHIEQLLQHSAPSKVTPCHSPKSALLNRSDYFKKDLPSGVQGANFQSSSPTFKVPQGLAPMEEFHQFEHIYKEFSTYGSRGLSQLKIFEVERNPALFSQRQNLYKRLKFENS